MFIINFHKKINVLQKYFHVFVPVKGKSEPINLSPPRTVSEYNPRTPINLISSL